MNKERVNEKKAKTGKSKLHHHAIGCINAVDIATNIPSEICAKYKFLLRCRAKAIDFARGIYIAHIISNTHQTITILGY